MASERDHLLRRLYETGRTSSRLSVLLRSAAAAELGITVTDGECLDFLLEAGTATAGQIASQTNLTTGAVTSMIRRLQRAGTSLPAEIPPTAAGSSSRRSRTS